MENVNYVTCDMTVCVALCHKKWRYDNVPTECVSTPEILNRSENPSDVYILLLLISSLSLYPLHSDKLFVYWHLISVFSVFSVLLLLQYSNISPCNYYRLLPTRTYSWGFLCFCFLFSFKNKHNIHKWDKNNI